MIGHGARMIYQGIFCVQSIYVPNSFDIFFDWSTLMILGLLVLFYTIKSFYRNIRNLPSITNGN
jgi:hypothetical protein